MASHPRILFIDAYDSFSNNIIALLETKLNAEIVKIYIDSNIADLSAFLKPFAAVICGPGPGHPRNRADVGIFRDIWKVESSDTIPVLGICLGFQSLVLEFGGSVQRLSYGRHGIETCVTTSSTSIFKGLSTVNAVQYHSLHATMDRKTSQHVDARSLWKPFASCPELLPLAWEMRLGREGAVNVGTNPHPILMAVKHTTKPYYGIQFHPESVCSQPNARQVIANWWDESKDWLKLHKPTRLATIRAEFPDSYPEGASEPFDDEFTDGYSEGSSLHTPPTPLSSLSEPSSPRASQELFSMSIELGCLTLPRICRALRLEAGEFVLLDSEMKPMPSLGESSIVGIVEPSTLRILYSIGTNFVTVQAGPHRTQVTLEAENNDIFAYLKAFMAKHEITNNSDRAFCGGLVGYITYEACLETIGVSATCHENRPDIHFVFVKKSIVVDHKRSMLYVQSLTDHDDMDSEGWVKRTTQLLSTFDILENGTNTQEKQSGNMVSELQYYQPSKSGYESKISQCQEHIRAGYSYELCLSDQTVINIETNNSSCPTPWTRYLRLRETNPAPFAAFLRLGALTLLSTSPERFMSWTRFEHCPPSTEGEQPEIASTCQFRPIKGTVSKERMTAEGETVQVSKEEATVLLSVVKERAENLMIVDLIRHDLYSVVSSWNVQVKALMAVEEYETVYQLVSVIEGRLFKYFQPSSGTTHRPRPRQCSNKNGIDVLAASLPPGSMTGAPKLRSCQLLQGIEQHQPRSIYSGILGYMCVSGKGDFSVVIRSVFKWDNGNIKEDEELWRIGAGGAVTGLSTEEGEWKEMLAKLKSTLGGFAFGM